MKEIPINRRSAIKGAASAIGLTSMTTPVLGSSEGSGNNTREIVKYRKYKNVSESGPETPVETEEVTVGISFEKWRRIMSVENAFNIILNQLRSEGIDSPDSVIAASVKKGSNHWTNRKIIVSKKILEKDIDDGNKPGISIGELRNRVPDHVSGRPNGSDDFSSIEQIPVQVEEKIQQNAICTGDFMDDDYQSIPGGCKITSGTNVGTVCTPINHETKDGFKMLTAGHVHRNRNYWQQGSSDYQLYDGAYVEDGHEDWGWFEPYGGDTEFSWTLANDNGGKDWVISGSVSWYGVELLIENETNIYSQGARTGRDVGNITEKEETIDGVRNVYNNSEGGTGDSGGPVYEVDDDSAYIINIINRVATDLDGDCPVDIHEGNHLNWVKDNSNLT